MCIECINRICCGSVNLNPRELALTDQYNEFTKKFLATRKTTLGFLSIVAVLSICINAYNFYDTEQLVIQISNQLNNDTVNVIVQIINALLGYFLAITIIIAVLIITMYMTWYKYRFNMTLSKVLGGIIILYPIILLYIPAKSIIYAYLSTGEYIIDVAIVWGVIFLIIDIVISSSVPTLLLLQTFLMRISSLSMQFQKVHEYRIIPLVLMIVYIPIYLILFGILFEITNDYWIYGFVITYTTYLMTPIICQNKYAYYLSWIFGIASLIIVGYLLLTYLQYNIYLAIIQSYSQCLLTNLLVSDFVNSIIMKFKNPDLDQEFGTLMKDLGYDHDEKIRLTLSEMELSNRKSIINITING